MNAFLSRDHHNKQRLHALRGYAQKVDRLDSAEVRTDNRWLVYLLAWVAIGAILKACGVL